MFVAETVVVAVDGTFLVVAGNVVGIVGGIELLDGDIVGEVVVLVWTVDVDKPISIRRSGSCLDL